MLVSVFLYNTIPFATDPLHHYRHGIHMVSLHPLVGFPTIILIPIVEIFLSPIKASCLQRFGILKRAGLGAALLLGGVFGIMALDVIGHEITNDVPCLVFANAVYGYKFLIPSLIQKTIDDILKGKSGLDFNELS